MDTMEKVMDTAQMSPISRTTTIGEAVKRYPQVATVFQSYGLACVGCHVAFWETLEQGARGHGMDEETIDNMVKDANAIAHESHETPKAGETIHLTKRAVAKVKEFMQRENKPNGILRICIVNGGCSGMSYDLALENNAKEDDHIITIDGLRVAVSSEHLDTLRGINIDFVDSLQGSGFKIDNP